MLPVMVPLRGNSPEGGYGLCGRRKQTRTRTHARTNTPHTRTHTHTHAHTTHAHTRYGDLSAPPHPAQEHFSPTVANTFHLIKGTL